MSRWHDCVERETSDGRQCIVCGALRSWCATCQEDLTRHDLGPCPAS